MTNSKNIKAEIDLMTNCMYIVKNGELIQVEPPTTGFGEQIAVWLGGKVDRVETKTSKKL